MKISAILTTFVFGALSLNAFALPAAPQGDARQVMVPVDTLAWGMPLKGVKIQQVAQEMNIALDLYPRAYRMKGDRVSVFTPMLVNGADTLELPGVGLYGRTRYIQYLRDGGEAVSGPQELSYRYSKRPEKLQMKEGVPYEDWMNGSTLYIKRCDYGCCNTLLNRELLPIGRWYYAEFKPAFHFVTPTAETVKTRQLKGRAYVDFPVNMTDLYHEYRNNPVELQKIIATIDSVRNDEDININEITIKGYASPESPWDNNTRLAKGRTATLKKYVENLYQFDRDLIKTDYWPEDWDGLREFVEKSGLEHKNEILALIDDTSIEPDPKEALLKKRYPEEYDFLYKTVYPGLRHSDYTILYTIRHFSDPAEISKIMAESPQKLSLDEFFILAGSLEPGSDEYNNVFETAVRMYPTSDVANLNAASSSMQRGDLAKAEQYLAKAGDSDAATYTRGVLAALNGDYDEALRLFNLVASTMPEAAQAAKEIQDIIRLQVN